MNPCAPQAFVCVNVPHAAEDMLIQQQRLDPGTSPAELRAKLILCCFQRIKSYTAQNLRSRAAGQKPNVPEPANIGVAQLAPVIECEENVGMRRHARFRRARHDLARHPEMNHQRQVLRVPIRSVEINHQEFSVSSHAGDLKPRQQPLNGGRVLDEIGFAQSHA